MEINELHKILFSVFIPGVQRIKKISDSLKYKLKDAYKSYLTEMLEDENKKKKITNFEKNRNVTVLEYHH